MDFARLRGPAAALFAAAVLALSAPTAPAPLLAQEAPAAAPAATQPGTAEPAADADAATQALRRTADLPPPRTLRAYWHVFAAFTLAWALIFGYTVSLGRRFRRLEEQVDALAAVPPAAGDRYAEPAASARR